MPSNLLLRGIGARKTFAHHVSSWGLCASIMSCIDPLQFYVCDSCAASSRQVLPVVIL